MNEWLIQKIITFKTSNVLREKQVYSFQVDWIISFTYSVINNYFFDTHTHEISLDFIYALQFPSYDNPLTSNLCILLDNERILLGDCYHLTMNNFFQILSFDFLIFEAFTKVFNNFFLPQFQFIFFALNSCFTAFTWYSRDILDVCASN
jgi:hypothetical protein